MILDGGPLISRACRGGTGPNVALGLVPRIGPQPIAKGLTTKTEPNLSKISQTVKTHRASIGRLTARRLAGPTFHLDESSLRPVAVEHDGPCIRLPGDD